MYYYQNLTESLDKDLQQLCPGEVQQKRVRRDGDLEVAADVAVHAQLR